MQILFEDDGELKAGTVRSATPAAFQVDSTTGKRLKVKAAAVLLRFDQPRADELLVQAQAEAAAIDVDFLWQCAPQREFGFEELARDYRGREPLAVEAAAILLLLQSAPIYFQRRGRGRFRPAAPEVLQAALAGIERRRLREEQRGLMVRQLIAGELPPSIAALGVTLLTHPDRNSVEFKAVEQAAHELGLAPLRLLLARGAIASPYEWHVQSFLARAFPRGLAFPQDLPPPAAATQIARLPLAPAAAFSIDDSTTTEIDDAFSVDWTAGKLVVGIHIAAPALALSADSAIDRIARERMSTVYAPGIKYTMLPEAWIEAHSLTAGRSVAALSLYLDVDPASYEILGRRSVLERVYVAANLRHDALDAAATADAVEAAAPGLPCASELQALWRLANVLRAGRERVRGRPEPAGRDEISIALEPGGAAAIEDSQVRLVVRRRDAPLDRIVAELMIHANSTWGAWLDHCGIVAIYRSQSQGRVRMGTNPAAHEGLGVARYAWCTSPLRRYVDLVNQRQLLAAVQGSAPAFQRGDAKLFSVVSGFEAAYAAYTEFQERMECYWSLRWLQQAGVRRVAARLAKGDLFRIEGLPLLTRLAAATGHPRGQRVELELGQCDLIELHPNARIVRVYAAEDSGSAAALLDAADEDRAEPEIEPDIDAAAAACAPTPAPQSTTVAAPSPHPIAAAVGLRHAAATPSLQSTPAA